MPPLAFHFLLPSPSPLPICPLTSRSPRFSEVTCVHSRPFLSQMSCLKTNRNNYQSLSYEESVSKMEKMGYKAHFEFWLETVSACSTALHKGRLQKRERCSEAVSVAGLSFPAEAGQNCRELAGHKDVFACVDGKPKPGAAVNCNDIF